MELTKEYFDQQLRNVATKDDLKNFATKDDLKNLATKNELGEIKSDIADLKNFVQTNMVTKQELDYRLGELPTRADFNKLQTAVDGLAKKFHDEDDERAANYDRLSRVEDWVRKAARQIGIEYKP